jgi:hypothetical protein
MTFIKRGKKITRMPLKMLCLREVQSIHVLIQASTKRHSKERLQEK